MQRDISQLSSDLACLLEGLSYSNHSMKLFSFQLATVMMMSELWCTAPCPSQDSHARFKHRLSLENPPHNQQPSLFLLAKCSCLPLSKVPV